LSAQKLADWLRVQTRASLEQMAERSRALAKPDATEKVASICADVAGARVNAQAREAH
jgi:UDP-N-acetylglucosamine--N-acetylmuramyl-(pentapeptide) pyrophosphoryl-undecaprenol N-acetylglucosamine transferase